MREQGLVVTGSKGLFLTLIVGAWAAEEASEAGARRVGENIAATQRCQEERISLGK